MSVIRLSLPLIPNTFGHIVVCVLSNIVWRILYVIAATSHQRCALYSICNSAPDTEAEYCDERVCVSVCACVCLSTVVARSSCGGVVIRCVLPVLCMTSYLLISQGCSTSPPS